MSSSRNDLCETVVFRRRKKKLRVSESDSSSSTGEMVTFKNIGRGVVEDGNLVDGKGEIGCNAIEECQWSVTLPH